MIIKFINAVGTHALKVVCNEKKGGPGRWQTFAIGLGL